MNHAIYGSFLDTKSADKAVGALMDHGIPADCISLVMDQGTADEHHLDKAKHGITTTTAGDTAAGAIKGGVTGLVLGALGALASLIIPGFGLVLGGGALATALGAAAGTAVGGAIAGAVHGTLKDQGVPDEVARKYDETVTRGGAVLAVQPCGGHDFDRAEVETILRKYGAEDIGGFPFAGAADLGTGLAAAETTRPLIERRPVTDGGDGTIGHLGEHETLRIPIRQEEVDADKRVRAVEEVSVGKRTLLGTEHVNETLRKERAVIEDHGDVDVHTRSNLRRDDGLL